MPHGVIVTGDLAVDAVLLVSAIHPRSSSKVNINTNLEVLKDGIFLEDLYCGQACAVTGSIQTNTLSNLDSDGTNPPIAVTSDMVIAGALTAQSINGGAEVQVQTAIEAHVPYFCAGRVAANGSVLTSRGSVGFPWLRTNTGDYQITFAQAHPDGANFIVSLTPERTSGTGVVDDISVTYNATTSLTLVANTRHQDDAGLGGDRHNQEFCFLVL